MKLLLLAGLLLSPSAYAKTLVCDYQDDSAIYRDEYALDAAETSAMVSFSVAKHGQSNFTKACWGRELAVHTMGKEMYFSGKLSCADGNQGDFTQLLNLETMQMDGSWRANFPCRWEDR